MVLLTPSIWKCCKLGGRTLKLPIFAPEPLTLKYNKEFGNSSRVIGARLAPVKVKDFRAVKELIPVTNVILLSPPLNAVKLLKGDKIIVPPKRGELLRQVILVIEPGPPLKYENFIPDLAMYIIFNKFEKHK